MQDSRASSRGTATPPTRSLIMRRNLTTIAADICRTSLGIWGERYWFYGPARGREHGVGYSGLGWKKERRVPLRKTSGDAYLTCARPVRYMRGLRNMDLVVGIAMTLGMWGLDLTTPSLTWVVLLSVRQQSECLDWGSRGRDSYTSWKC
jgi:hypothetical protein